MAARKWPKRTRYCLTGHPHCTGDSPCHKCFAEGNFTPRMPNDPTEQRNTDKGR
jgi:hypothetical protein